MLERMRVDEFLSAVLSLAKPLEPLDLPLLDAHGATLASDVFAGDRLVLKAGTPIRSTQIGLAASIGLDHLPTRPLPRVVILSAGPDLVEPGQPVSGQQEYETNSWQLTTMVREIGGVGYRVHHIPDDEVELKNVIEDQLVRADLLVLSGERHDDSFDLITRTLNQIGSVKMAELDIEGSGRHNFGTVGPDNTPVITLPGDPIAAYISMQLFVRPVIRTMFGAKEIHCPAVKARLEKSVNDLSGKRNYLRAFISEDKNSVMALSEQDEFLTLASANSLIAVTEGAKKLGSGEEVTVVLLPKIK
jgi:molybdopterin biosynthesis enzyme